MRYLRFGDLPNYAYPLGDMPEYGRVGSPLNMNTLYNAIRDGIADNANIKSWCQTNYSQDHKVYAGLDDRHPPAESECPYVYLFMDSKQVGYRLEQKAHAVGVICEINNDSIGTVVGKANIVVYTGINHSEDFRKLVETAAIAAVAELIHEAAVEQIDISYEDSDPFPYFRSYMAFSINENYYMGDSVFE